MVEFVNSAGATNFPNIADFDGDVWSNFGVTNQSTYIFVNHDGRWRTSGYGSLPSDVVDLVEN